MKNVIDNNRAILSIIAEKLRNNKLEELSDEQLLYVRVLLSNKFMLQDGTVTQEGKDALYN